MAKKNAARHKAIAESQPSFDDSKYGNVLYSMTFDYNELSHAGLLGVVEKNDAQYT